MVGSSAVRARARSGGLPLRSERVSAWERSCIRPRLGCRRVRPGCSRRGLAVVLFAVAFAGHEDATAPWGYWCSRCCGRTALRARGQRRAPWPAGMENRSLSPLVATLAALTFPLLEQHDSRRPPLPPPAAFSQLPLAAFSRPLCVRPVAWRRFSETPLGVLGRPPRTPSERVRPLDRLRSAPYKRRD